MSSNSEIEVARLSDPFNARFRAFTVVIDSESEGKLRDGESQSFSVKPGEHELNIKIDWIRSNRVVISCERGQVHQFQCWPRSALFGVLSTCLPWIFTGIRLEYLGARSIKPES